jgi:hypothetical protein
MPLQHNPTHFDLLPGAPGAVEPAIPLAGGTVPERGRPFPSYFSSPQIYLLNQS